ncbi:hypothetical protein PESP_a3203 [Pseudoalteromonas espejiana DSM 9414]|nr:hypothetical protein PESP_a3203 [Pseudoalteromonas espejiana DSM 9414]
MIITGITTISLVISPVCFLNHYFIANWVELLNEIFILFAQFIAILRYTKLNSIWGKYELNQSH